MDRAELMAVVADWSYWDRPLPGSVPRQVDLPDVLSDSVALAVQGVRRCGKSTLLHQLVGHYRLDRGRCAFVNFEDPRLSNALSHELLDSIVAAFRAQHPDADRLYFMFDEIQEVAGWERWLRSQLDRPLGNVFVITGSNASLLSGELGSTLTGRHLTVELFPFDLLEARTHDPTLTVADYLHLGGFPEPLGRRDGDRLRRQYVHDIVERDVRERIGARSSLPIRQVVQMAYESAGSETSLRRVAGAVGIAVDTAAGYLEACEDAYLLFGVPFFAYSERKRAAYNRKYYPVDPGLRRVAVTRTGDDLGKALECATHTVLRRRHGEVYYWRGAGEVDFVVTDGDRETPVQVTWDGPQERHHRALEAFYEAFPRANEALIVTADTFADFAGAR
ncbi:MAG TPA: ATP-binding protein [Ilumatobacter sp.]|nr:ATP-binding protein [Ilumatobacter sp.]